VVLGVPDQPCPQPILRRQQRRGHQDQVRHQRPERVLARAQQQHAAGNAADDADRHGQHQSLALAGEVTPLRDDAADHARPQRDGVGDVGGDGRHADRRHRRERDERAATRDRVDHAGGHAGEADEAVLQGGGRHRHGRPHDIARHSPRQREHPRAFPAGRQVAASPACW
jgi:hypothetical protein